MKTTITLTAIILLASFLKVNAQSQVNHHFFANATYLVSSNADNSNPSKTLFTDNGLNFGASNRYGGRLGIFSSLQYSFGEFNKKNLNSFAKSFDSQIPLEIKQSNSNWSMLRLMSGPSFLPFKKTPLNINILGGIGYRTNPNTILIRENDNGFIGKTFYEATEKKLVPVWEISAMYPITNKLKNTALWLTSSYGSNGFSGGVILSMGSSCCLLQCPCSRLCPCDPPPKNR